MSIKIKVVGVAATLALTIGGSVASAPAAEAAPKSVATVKEYKKIKKGQSLAKVQRIIGSKGHRSERSSDANVPWIWRGTQGKDVYVSVFNGTVTGKWRIPDKTVTKSEYKKIKKGQSYKKVKSIIREKGKLSWQQGNEKRYYWSSEGCDRFVNVLFVRGKVKKKSYAEPGYGSAPCSS